jgi:DNA-binding beta-propeller fold protein YncE
MKSRIGSRRTSAVVVLSVGLLLAAAFPAGAAVPFSVGDVFAAIGNSQVKHFSPTGTLLETLNDTSGTTFTAGMCFDTSGNLYVTNFDANSISKFDNTGTLVAAAYISGIATAPESCVFDTAGNL